MNPEQTSKYQKILRLIPNFIGAASCWWMAITLFRTWQTPMAVEDGRWVHLGVGIMVLEFILVHSGAMLPALASAPAGVRLKPLLFVSALYVVFAATFAFGLKSMMLLWIFSGIMIPRWIGVVIDSRQAKEQQVRRSSISVMLYIGVVFLSVLVRFPEGGLTTEVLDRVYPQRGHGEWERSPQQALVAGIIYFSITGLVEIITAIRQRAIIPSPQTQTDSPG